MAFSSGLVWEIQQNASDQNGGGFRGGANLTTPAAPTVAISAGGSITNATYYVVVTETDGNGETPKSTESSVVSSGSNHTITVTAPSNPSVQGSTWSVYFGTVSGGPYFLGTAGSGLAFGANYAITTTPPTTGTQAPGVDYSQQTAAQQAYTDIVIDGTTNTLCTSAAHPFTPAHVGNVINITAGTGFTVQRVEITGVTAAGVATVDKSLGTLSSTGGTGNLGGALATPGMAGALVISANGVFIKYSATAYNATSTTNVAGGCYLNGNSAFVSGYNTTRSCNNTDALRPTVNAASDSMTVFQGGGNNHQFANLIAAGNGHSSVTGFSTGGGANAAWYNLKADTCATGFNANGNAVYHESCEASACATGFTTNSSVIYHACVARASTTAGFTMSGGTLQVYVDCISVGGTGSTIGFTCAGSTVYINCTAQGNAGSGFKINVGGAQGTYLNCVAYGNTGTGFLNGSTNNNVGSRLLNCAAGGNGTDVSTSWAAAQQVGFVTLTASPFTSAAGNDFSLNTTAGGGAALRAAGYPASFPGLSTSSYPDVGAVQHADPANVPSGGGTRICTGM